MDQERFEVVIPPELEAGVYASFLSPWHGEHELTLDFVAPSDETKMLVTARVRMPATAIFDAIRALNDAMTRYELHFGEIRPPERHGDDE